MTATDTETVTPIGSRKPRRRFRSWQRWLISTGVVAVAVLVAWVVFFSSWLGLRSVEVKGVHSVSSQQVKTAVQVAPGTPLARVNLDAVASRVESIPAVASATATRSWPHSIVVTVTERQPVGLMLRDGSWWLMDKTGLLYGKAVERAANQPIVELGPGAGPQTLPQVASMLGSLPQSLLTLTRRVSAQSIDSITLLLKDGSEVRWGSATDSAVKVAVVTALLKHKAAIYDVSIPSQPATKG